MKTLKPIIIAAAILLTCQGVVGQLTPLKKFDYSLLEGKTLYIPTYKASEAFIKKMAKKGKYEKITTAKAKAEHYNTIWNEAMAESSYDATDYEIRAFDRRKLIKEKNKKAILLYFYRDDYGNRSAIMMATAPKKRVIARTIITGLDLSSKNDLRLMINMLNESLNTASELEEEGDKSNKALRNKYKEEVIKFTEELENKVFLVPKSEHKKPKKAAARTADLKEALKSWKLSKYELTTAEAIENKRVEGDMDSFYWRDFPIYTQNALITYHYNVILSCDGDDVLFAFLGKKRLKPATLEQIQKKIVAKGARYKKQMAK